MIRILHLITDLDIGGAEMSLSRLLAGMDPSLFENRVVSLIPAGRLGEKIRSLGIPVDSLGMKPGRLSLAALWRLVRHIRTFAPDVLQTWLYHADLMGLVAGRLCGLKRIVWNIRSANINLAYYRRLSGLVVWACARLSDLPQAVVVNSHAGREVHAGLGYHPQRWVLIPNGMDMQAYRPDTQARRTVRVELGLDPDAIIIGMIARYDPMKDHANFIQAAGILARTGLPVHFLLAGQGVEAGNSPLAEMVEQHGLSSRMHLLGYRQDVARLDAAVDIMAMTSSGEGFPNAVAEAMASGVPCAVTDVGDAAYLVGDTGRVVPPRDPVAMAKAWEALIRLGMEDRQHLGTAARQRIIEHFSIQNTVKAYQEFYHSLLTREREMKEYEISSQV